MARPTGSKYDPGCRWTDGIPAGVLSRGSVPRLCLPDRRRCKSRCSWSCLPGPAARQRVHRPAVGRGTRKESLSRGPKPARGWVGCSGRPRGCNSRTSQQSDLDGVPTFVGVVGPGPHLLHYLHRHSPLRWMPPRPALTPATWPRCAPSRLWWAWGCAARRLAIGRWFTLASLNGSSCWTWDARR